MLLVEICWLQTIELSQWVFLVRRMLYLLIGIPVKHSVQACSFCFDTIPYVMDCSFIRDMARRTLYAILLMYPCSGTTQYHKWKKRKKNIAKFYTKADKKLTLWIGRCTEANYPLSIS